MEYRTKSIFGKYAEQLQVLVDLNVEKFKEPFFPKYFSMGSPQVGLTYATAIGKARIEAAASVVSHGAEAPLRGRAGLDKLTGEVAAIKVKRRLDEKDYREYLTLQAMSAADEVKKSQILQLIYDDVKYVNDSVMSRVDIMAAQALSRGIIPINATTNPDGIVDGDIDLLVPSDHKEHGGDAFGWDNDNRFWGTAATATPISDIRKLVQDAWNNDGRVFDRVLMTPSKWWDVQKSKEVTDAFDGLPTLDNFNSFLQSQQLPIIELVNVRAKIEKDGKLSTVKTWEDDKYVTFVPEGDLGKIHNAIAIEQIQPVANVNYAVSNNVLISKWSQTEPFGEYTRGEISAFPGLEVADTMHIVNVQHRSSF